MLFSASVEQDGSAVLRYWTYQKENLIMKDDVYIVLISRPTNCKDVSVYTTASAPVGMEPLLPLYQSW